MQQPADVSGLGPLSGILRQINAAAKDGNATLDDLVSKFNDMIAKAKDTNITDTDWPVELRTLLQSFEDVPVTSSSSS